ncbi:DUF3054 domain-containing protein [Nakamurella sp.]|uniref:DUF3054 domain-containing protein n=1 Tax=Nakamurella sp. TaxID=1869182 RepID=UPI00378374BF
MTRLDPSTRPRTRRPLAALSIDVALVLIFAAIGRSSHGEDVLVGLAGTAWPFLVGLLVGWLLAFVGGSRSARGRFDPWRIRPAGLLIWAGTIGVGMLARVVAGQGTAPSFIVVAGVVLALFLLGWRALASVIARGRR